MTPERAREILSHGILWRENITKDERWDLIETMRRIMNNGSKYQMNVSKLSVFTVLKAISEGAIK